MMTFDINALMFRKSMDLDARIARYYNLFYLLFWHSRSHTLMWQNILIFLIISCGQSTTNFLVTKNVLLNNKNAQCNKCESELNLYIH